MKNLLSRIEKSTIRYILGGFGLLVLTIPALILIWDSGYLHRNYDVVSIFPFGTPILRLILIGVIPLSVSIAMFLTGIVMAYYESSVNYKRKKDIEE